MKLLFSTIFSLIPFLIVSFSAFANGDEDHAPGTPHTEAASIDPTMVIGIVIFLVIGGLILWKFVLHAPKSSSPTQASPPKEISPTQEKTVSQSGKGEGSEKAKSENDLDSSLRSE